jgi:hypothetical protein
MGSFSLRATLSPLSAAPSHSVFVTAKPTQQLYTFATGIFLFHHTTVYSQADSPSPGDRIDSSALPRRRQEAKLRCQPRRRPRRPHGRPALAAVGREVAHQQQAAELG